LKTAVTRARRCLLTAALLLAAAGAQAAICYVAPVAADHPSNTTAPFGDAGNSGADWGHPLTLQAALGNSACTDIRLRQGVYKPGPNAADHFAIDRPLQLRGGYTGNPEQAGERVLHADNTVLSGDIGNDDTHSTGGITPTAADIQGTNNATVMVIGGTGFYGNGNYAHDEGDASFTLVEGLTITGGQNDNDSGGGLACNGLHDEQPRSCGPALRHLRFSGNSARYGGAIVLRESSPAISHSTFSGNSAGGLGGAIYLTTSSPTISHSTFSGNSAGYSGGALATDVDGNPVISHSTFVGNSAEGEGGAFAKNGILGAPSITASILWGNQARTSSQIFFGLGPLGTTSITNSIVQGGATGAGNLDEDPKLGPLQDNGGATLTMLPAQDSPAIDAVDCAAGVTTDQRGVARPQGSTCDIGAVERRQGSYTLNVSVTGTGTVSGGADDCAATTSSCSASYVSEITPPTTVTLTATPETHWHFTGWGGACSGTGNCTVTMDQARSVTAQFAIDTLAVTAAIDPASPADSGTFGCASPADYGTTASCTAQPATGYVTQSISGCGGTATGPGVNDFTTGTVTEACTVTATFKLKTYAVATAVTPAGAGTLTCEPASVQHGGSTTCTATAADAGFTLAGFDGCVRTGDSNQCTLSDVQADTTVTARFTAVTTFNGTTVPTGEPASASFTGGGESCRFDTETAFVAPPAAPPEGQTLPQGMFRFKLIGCEPGSTVAMSVTWPRPVAGYVKYGPAASGAQPGYFEPTALAIDGRTVTFTVQDGALGDDDGQANGEITDPSGPTARVAFIPTLGAWGLLLLSLLAGGLGVLARRRKV